MPAHSVTYERLATVEAAWSPAQVCGEGEGGWIGVMCVGRERVGGLV